MHFLAYGVPYSSPTLTRSASGDACRENANKFGPCDVEGQADE